MLGVGKTFASSFGAEVGDITAEEGGGACKRPRELEEVLRMRLPRQTVIAGKRGSQIDDPYTAVSVSRRRA